MKTKFKINNATEKAGNEKIFIVSKILDRCNIQYAEWLEILFETGCSFVEKNMRFKCIQQSLLTDKSFGFWDWWLIIFIEDDEMLLTFNDVVTPKLYLDEKMFMLHVLGKSEQFRYFLQSNKKLNEKV